MPTDIATRALVVTLKAPSGAGKTSIEIQAMTGIPRRTIDDIYCRAIKRGFEPNERPLRLKNAWLEDAPRPGRPSKQTQENKDLIFMKHLRLHCDEDTQGGRLQENEADEEAWTDDEDEEGTTAVVS
jgi:hypothetical protein